MPLKPASNKPLGVKVRHARELAGLTQLALAHRAGRKGLDAGAYISHVESGHVDPRLGTLKRIASALGVNLETLLSTGKGG